MSQGAVVTKHPTTKEEMGYQRADGFESAIVVGGDAPDGAALTLEGDATTLLAEVDSSRLTILNFGSCT